MSKVSVIMPAYNAANFIAESIQSVLDQTYLNWELIIIDDGSTDNTKDIVYDYIKRDSRIKYLWQKNGKAGKARNLGIAHSEGKYIAFLDADDLWLPNKLELQITFIENSEVDVVFSDSYIFNGFPISKQNRMNIKTGLLSGEDGITRMLIINRVPLSTVLAKKAVIQKVGGFTESPSIPQAEDYHLWLKLLFKSFSFWGMDEVLCAYRDHENSTSKADRLAKRFVIEALYDLSNLYTDYRTLIMPHLKNWFIRYHYNIDDWNHNEYRALIWKNCKYINNGRSTYFFQLMHSLLGTRFTRKIITRFVNG